MPDSKAIIIVGGPSRGTRFRPLSLDVPKPLFPVAGHPIIFHHLSALRKFPSLKEVLLIGFYEETVFREFLRSASEQFPNWTIKYLREYQALGTAGGLYLFRDAILKGDPKTIIVMHADVCCSFPLEEMLSMHNETKAIGTMLGMKVSPEAASNFGCIVSDPQTHEVLHYVEKPSSYISSTINCGVYLFDTSLFGFIREVMNKREEEKATPGSGYVDPYWDENRAERGDGELRLEQDILAPLSQSKKLFVYESKDFWRQIKSASSAVPANALYLQQALQSPSSTPLTPLTPPSDDGPEIVPPVYIHPSASVHCTAKIGPNVSISENARIGPGARIKNSIILAGAEIAPHAVVLHSVVAWDTRIGAWARVEGMPLGVQEHSGKVVRGGVKVDAATILGREVVVGEGVVVRHCIVLPNKAINSDVSNEVSTLERSTDKRLLCEGIGPEA